MTRPATRLREGLERVRDGWKRLNVAEQDHGFANVPDDVVEQLEAAEADLALGEEGSAEQLLEALNDEYQRGREAMRRELEAAREAAR